MTRTCLATVAKRTSLGPALLALLQRQRQAAATLREPVSRQEPHQLGEMALLLSTSTPWSPCLSSFTSMVAVGLRCNECRAVVLLWCMERTRASSFTPTADPLGSTTKEVTPSKSHTLDQLRSEYLLAFGKWRCVLPTDVTTLAHAELHRQRREDDRVGHQRIPALCERMPTLLQDQHVDFSEVSGHQSSIPRNSWKIPKLTEQWVSVAQVRDWSELNRVCFPA